MKMKFEWDAAKARRNYKKHDVSFEMAIKVFDDPFALEFIDDREDWGEERFVILGRAGQLLVYVAYTEREECIRVISARRLTPNEEEYYFRQNS